MFETIVDNATHSKERMLSCCDLSFTSDSKDDSKYSVSWRYVAEDIGYFEILLRQASVMSSDSALEVLSILVGWTLVL